MLEDTAAMIGLAVAFVGIALAQALQLPWIDGATSIVIGLVLLSTAAFLAIQSKALLIGEGADPVVDAGIRAVVAEQPEIEQVSFVITQHLGPDEVLANIVCDFRDTISAAEVEQVTALLRARIQKAYPLVKRVFIEARSAK